MKKTLGLVAALSIALLAAAAVALADDGRGGDDGANPITLAVYGDAPYGTSPTDNVQFLATPAFIQSINADPRVEGVIHVGDIHSGKQLCTQAYDQSIFDLWTAFVDPVVYTPGDNEWTDCQKPAEGGGDPIANLALVRSIFFSHPGLTLGVNKKLVLSQGQIPNPLHPSDRKYVENVMWERSGVLFATVNIPGGSNNDTDVWFGAATPSAAQTQEVAERTGADLRWLDAAFAVARFTGAKAVVLVEQADMWDLDGKAPSHLVGYDPFVQTIATNTAAFGKPVIMFNGDSHEYKSDNPLSASDPLNYLHPGYNVANFHRVVVHGSTLPLEWLRLKVDTRANGTGANAFGPFTWERVQH